MGKPGRPKSPGLGDLAEKIRTTREVVKQAEQVAADTAIQDPTITAHRLSAIMKKWVDSDVPALACNDEQLAVYYDSMMKSILVRMLEALNSAFIVLGGRINIDNEECMSTKELVDVISTLGHLMVSMKKASSGEPEKPAPNEHNIDALILEAEERLKDDN